MLKRFSMMLTKYKLYFHPSAASQYKELAQKDKLIEAKVRQELQLLSSDLHQGIAMTGKWKRFFKVRVKSYKIVYQIVEDSIIVYLVREVEGGKAFELKPV
ncbi:MAG: type II toxin-antitoxin system RelE/ParE family toxin [Candidatus Riflebacteria bacterium]|nr:type II toxin-antitoxin system RelE/ParE family toxin [Candidatus Riflebacteria bacterium]